MKEATSRSINERVIAVGPLGHCVDCFSELFHVKGKDAVNSCVSLVEGLSWNHILSRSSSVPCEG